MRRLRGGHGGRKRGKGKDNRVRKLTGSGKQSKKSTVFGSLEESDKNP